jgi:hypothetical protein
MPIYLYVKTHQITGLKYLGQTTSTDPHRYTGSGKYWKNHLAVHGYYYNTEILKECQSKDGLKEWGLYYSRLWNVAESKEWANLKEEGGAYGNHSSETRAKISAAQRGQKRGAYSQERREQIANQNRTKAKDPKYRAKLSKALLGHSVSSETRAKISKHSKLKAQNPEWIATQRKNSLNNGSKPPSQKGIPWWTNEIANKKQLECPGEGWRSGMAKKKT